MGVVQAAEFVQCTGQPAVRVRDLVRQAMRLRMGDGLAPGGDRAGVVADDAAQVDRKSHDVVEIRHERVHPTGNADGIEEHVEDLAGGKAAREFDRTLTRSWPAAGVL